MEIEGFGGVANGIFKITNVSLLSRTADKNCPEGEFFRFFVRKFHLVAA